MRCKWACGKVRGMGKSFDIGLETLTGIGLPSEKAPASESDRYMGELVSEGAQAGVPVPQGATFYLETFGCQMNDHDSEKVAGVLLARGYRQVDGPEAAKVILYNTCSIREKAAQKVFSRLGELRPAEERNGKSFNTEGTVEEHAAAWPRAGRVHREENGAVPRSAQAGVPVPHEPKHPSL